MTTTTTTATVTFQKLRSGAWGLRSTRALTPGASVEVSKRDGSRDTKTVGPLVWSGEGVYLYAIGGTSTRGSSRGSSCGSSRRGGRYECDECGDFVTRGTKCWETGMTH